MSAVLDSGAGTTTRAHRACRIASRPGSGHIAGLDGLRALAIGAVLIYHLRPSTLPGGFLGVDVFFVLSGFLITTLLLRELGNRGHVQLRQFWMRRARRLLPALITVVLGSVSLAWLVGGDLLVNIGRQTLGALTFSNNWLEIAAGSDYFARTSPLLFVNFWSLAIEEQFYLLWPIVLVIIVALSATMRTRARLVSLVALASAVAMVIMFSLGAEATRVYYGTDTHLFGLMIGAAVALMWQQRDSWLHSRHWQRWRLIAAVAAWATLLTLMRLMHVDAWITFRGGILLASVATAVMLAALLGRGSVYDRLMELPPLRWIGERSYGIYLWHWPMILIFTEMLPATTYDSAVSWTIRGLALGATLVIAGLSYRWIEQPVRKYGFLGAFRAVGGQLRGPRPAAARTALGAAVALTVVTTIAIATAPTHSATHEQLLANAALLEEAQRGSPSPGDTPSSGPAPDATPSPTPTATVDPVAEQSPSPSPTPTVDRSVPDGSEISGFGDSIMVTSAHGLTYRWPDMHIDAKSNRQWPDAVEAVTRALDEGVVRRGVVLDFGTNAGVDEALVRQVLDALGPERMIVVVNLYGGSYWIPEANEALDNVVADYPNAIIADWYSAIGKEPGQLQSDHIHPNIPGGHLYTDVVAEAFVELAERLS